MNLGRFPALVLSVSLACGATAALGQAAPNCCASPDQQPPPQFQPKGGPLAALLVSTLVNAVGDVFRAHVQVVADKLKPGPTPVSSSMNQGGQSNANQQPLQQQPAQQTGASGMQMNTGDVAGGSPQPQGGAAWGKNLPPPGSPGLAMRIMRLDDSERPTGEANPLDLTMPSGAKYVLQVVTNTPGLVMIQSQDAPQKLKGEISTLDVVEVGPTVFNSLPADGTHYALDEVVGPEQLRVLFQPCLTRPFTAESRDAALAAVTAYVPGGSQWASKGTIKLPNQRAAEAANQLLKPEVAGKLRACDRTALNAAGTRGFSEVSNGATVEGNTIFSFMRDTPIVELVANINHTARP